MVSTRTKRRGQPPEPTAEVAAPDPQAARFEAALQAVARKAERDPYILAALLFGSLSYDQVWEKSDIDLFLICRDEREARHGRPGECRGFSLVEDGVNIHASMMGRARFKRLMEGSARGSFLHSAFSKSRLLFTKDESIRDLYENVHRLGARDREAQLLRTATNVIPILYKAQKWLRVRRDPNYSFVYIMHCVTSLAQIEVFLDNQIPTREVIQQALRINPTFFDAIYTDLINRKKTDPVVAAALEAIDGYLSRKTRTLFGPVLDYLDAAGAPRSATEIDNYFADHMGVEGATTACEWLADQDVIRKLSSPVRLTEKSRVELEEMAFYYEKEDAAA